VAEPITGEKSSSEAGHAVKLTSPEFVKPFVKTNKNDANDALAIVEAASRPSMNFVPIKQVEQQDIQSIHRIRTRVVKNRTALINEIRGLCLEYGVMLTTGAAKVKPWLCAAIASCDNELTTSSRESMQDFYEELVTGEEFNYGVQRTAARYSILGGIIAQRKVSSVCFS
jgi:transposase